MGESEGVKKSVLLNEDGSLKEFEVFECRCGYQGKANVIIL